MRQQKLPPLPRQRVLYPSYCISFATGFMVASSSRRAALLAAGTLVGNPSELFAKPAGELSITVPPPLTPRLDAASLSPLTAFGVSSREGDLRYPQWLEGTWRARNRIAQFSMPLGRAFVDAFTQATAEEDVALQEELEYLLRYTRTSPVGEEPTLTVAQDRQFNAVEETNAFLGDDGAVRTCVHEVNPAFPHGHLVIDVLDAVDEAGGGGKGTKQGSTRIELTVLWAQWGEASGGAFVTSELIRQRVTRAPGAYEPVGQDEVTLLEVLTRFERVASSRPSASPRVRVRNRIAQYLSLPGLGPEADAGLRGKRMEIAKIANGRAISFFDYDWELERIDDARSSALGSGRPV